ncbi:hypothetical protein N7467_005672 [Penicillium canescens]|nr:hypothetical protein N7467_005672 [Penicillium canescens]
MDAWKEAYDGLSPTLKACLVRAKEEKADILTALLKEAESKKTLCLQKRWKVKLSGKTIVLRDVFDKIIAWVHKFRAIGDTAVQFDPAPASLAWAGVRFLLQVCMSDSICFESTIHGLEVASRMIVRYTAFESIYTQRTSALQRELKSRLVGLYAQILQFLGNAVEYFNRSATTRLVKSVFQTSQNDELDKIAELDTQVEKLARISDAQIQLQIWDDVQKTQTILDFIRTPLSRVVDTLTIYTRNVEQQQFIELLTWISSVPYSQHHATHSESRLPESTKWLLKHPRYIDWNESSTSSILLLHGIPGSGKTNIASSVVDFFLDYKSRNPLAAPLAYFYCGDSKIGIGRADPQEIMRCLTRQLAVIDRQKREVHEDVVFEYQRKIAEAKLDGVHVPRLKIPQCADLILGILGSNPATIVIDGVDEIEESRRHELLDALKRIRDESASVVKIFLSSREDRTILTRLSDALMLRVEEGDTRQDMELFVKDRLASAISTQRLLGGDVPQDLQQKLTAFLLERSGGMFLWVILQLDRLFRLKSRASVVESMRDSSKATSQSLCRLYSDMLGHLHEADPTAYDIAKRAFSWLMCMHEPLTPEALLSAISMSSPEEQRNITLSELLHVCSNLVFVDSKLNTLRFIHFSFKEFLEAKPEFGVSCINTIAAHGCLNTCIQNTPSNLRDAFYPKLNFELYATLYWTRHYKAATCGEGHSSILSKLREFVFYDDGDTNLSFLAWLDTVEISSELLPSDHPLKTELNAVTSTSMTPIFTACIYGIDEVVVSIATKENFDVNEKSTIGHTPLYLAATFGHDEIIRILLSRGASPSIEGGKHGNSVNAACANGHVVAAQLLLSHESSSMSSDDGESALQKSLASGHESVALFLLQDYIKISDQTNYTKTVEQASQAGIFQVVQWLIKAYPSFSKTNASQTKLLEMAIMKGQLSFLKRYCLKGQLPDDSVANGAAFGHVDIISFCLDEGASIEKEGPLGTPLRAASLMGHEMAVRLLIARGADINAPGKFGDALQAAAINGHRSITHVLIQNNAHVNAQGGYYGNSLQAAASRGHREVAEALLNAGARVADKGRHENAFFAAAEAGHHAVVGLFIEKGFQLSRRRQVRYSKSSYRNLLRGALTAAQYGLRHKQDKSVSLPIPDSGLEESFKRLRGNISSNSPSRVASKVQDLKIPARGEHSSLVSTASKGWELVVQYMMAEKTKIQLSQDDLELALREAAYHGHMETAKFILASDIKKACKTSNALMAAAQNGHIAIIQMLIRHETDSDSLSHENALLIARYGSRGNQISSVRYPLSQVPHKDKRILVASAFKQAAKFNSACILEAFDQHGDYVEKKVVQQAFQIAASNGSTAVVQFLLASSYANCLESEHHLLAFRGACFFGHAALAEILRDHFPLSFSSEHLKVLFMNAAFKGYRGVLNVFASEIKKLDCCQTLLDMCLCFACAEGEVDAASFLIDAGACVNTRVDRTMGVDEDPGLVGLCLDEASDEDRNDRKGGTRRKPKIHARGSRRFVYYENCIGQWTALQACLQSPRQFQFQRGDLEGPPVLASKHIAVLHLLVSRNIDVNRPGEDGHTPLHWAASREIMCSPMVSLLLSAGAELSIDEAETEGSCSLMQIALRFFEIDGRFKASESVQEVFSTGPGAVIKLLLESKPDLSAADSRFSLVLEMAATIGNADYIRLLIDRGVHVNASGHFFGHAIIAAGRFGHIDCVRLLITAGADVTIAHPSHGTALQAAVTGGHKETAHTLLGHGIDINTYRNSLFPSTDPADAPALHLAINRGSFDIANLLLDAGADVNIVPPFVSPPLLAACAHGDVEFVKRLLQQGANVNMDGQKRESSSQEAPVADEEASALHKACAEGRDDLVPILLENSADIEKRVNGSLTPLEVAAKAGHLVVLDQLLEAGAAIYDPSREVNAVRAACTGKNPIPSIRLLRQRLKEGSAHFTSAFDEAVPAALREGYGDLLVCLVQDVPKRPSLLHHACVLGSTSAAELILNQGVDVNVTFGCGGQPLHVACYYQRPQLVSLLIKRGAVIHKESLSHGTPIQAALEGYVVSSPRIDRQPFYDMLLIQPSLQAVPKNADGASDSAQEDRKIACESNVLTLVRGGAKADVKGRPIGPLLHLAAYIGSIPLIRLFLQTGVDINTPGGYFGSALLAAVYAQQQDTVAYLLDQGIDANIFSANFGTSLHLACHQEDWDKTRTVRTLLEHRANVNASGSKSESPLSALLSSNMTGWSPATTESTFELILQTAAGLKVRPEDIILAMTVDDKCSTASGKEKTERLLKHDSTAQVTFDVIKHAVESRRYGNTARRLAKLLHRSNGIYVTESILKSASSPKVLEVLLRYTPRCEVTDAVFETLARSQPLGREYVKVLLDQDHSALPTVAVMIGFLETQFRLEKDDSEFTNVLKMLLDRNPNMEVTEEMLAATKYSAEREILQSRAHNRADR